MEINDSFLDDKYDHAVAGFSERMLHDKDEWFSHVNNLPDDLRVAYLVILLHHQVFNGGFHQYFFNPYGQFVYLTLEAFKLSNMPFAHSLLTKVLSKVNGENYSEDEFRERVFNRRLDRIVNFDDDLGDALDSFDSEYYGIADQVIERLYVYLTEKDNL